MSKAVLPDWIKHRPDRPLSIAHRGASAYAPDNTLKAFHLAAKLGADMWEVDIQISSDDVPIACHDADLNSIAGVSSRVNGLSAKQLSMIETRSGEAIPTFDEVISLALETGTALYLDVKDQRAADATLARLAAWNVEKAIFGTTDPTFSQNLKRQGCRYPVSILIGLGKDPFEQANLSAADIIHPCWEKAGNRPDRLLDAAFFSEAQRRDLPVVTWHEERPDVLAALCRLPVFGICSDTPQALKPYRELAPHAPRVVSHRGANCIAPENTLAAANASFAAGFDYVEVDVHQTIDGKLIAMHDRTVDRTTNGSGQVIDQTFNALQRLDAGSWYSDHFSGEKIPSLDEMITSAKTWRRKLYIELKDADPISVLTEVEHHEFLEECLFWSSDYEKLLTLKTACPSACVIARRQDYANLTQCLYNLQPSIIEFTLQEANSEEFGKVRQAGSLVMIAYMGDDLSDLKQLASLRSDLVNIDSIFRWRDLIQTMQ